MADTAFHQKEQMGPPKPEGLVDEQEAHEKKMFNRRKMGGFLMELGLNILSSNRDDAGAAVGDAFGKTVSARTERRRVSAAEELAKQERERKTRREDESDVLKKEKADREVAAEKRAAKKAETADLQKYELEGGKVGWYSKAEGIVKDEKGNAIILTKKDIDKLSANGIETSWRQKKRTIGEYTDSIKEQWMLEGSDSDDKAIAALGDNPTRKDFATLAKKWMDTEEAILKGEQDADNDPLGLL